MIRKKRGLGLAITDELSKASKGHIKKIVFFSWQDNLIPNFDPDLERMEDKNKWASLIFLSLTIVAFFLLFLRLFHLQIVMGAQNRNLADGNRIQIRTIHAPRGVIYDRNGKILAANSPGFRLINASTLRIRILNREQALELEVKNDPRAKNLEVDNIRLYPLQEITAHVVGVLGDGVGKGGVEAEYEDILKGVDGGEIIEVDSQGNKIRTLRTNPPISGQNITLTINADLQKLIYNKLKEEVEKSKVCCGAAVAIDPQNGQILALVSLPSFNPNLFTHGGNDQDLIEILTDSNSPILNRVIGGTYPPGSTFKIISSIAALESGKITPQTMIEDIGIVRLGSFSFSNWYFSQYGKTEGNINLIKAIQRSNDTFYYQTSRIIGEKTLAEWARKLYLNKKLGIDLPGEVEGLVPSDEWKFENFGERWYPGDTLHMSIGQGFLLTTPLQVLGFTSYVAADGVLYQPKLVLKTARGDTQTSKFKPNILISNISKKDFLKVVKIGLEQVPKNGGTAWPFFTFPIQTAGKTGTAEFGHPKNKTHAWYTAYAPTDDPKIAMTVLIEAGGEGSTNASPIVKEAFRWYFSPDKSKLIKDVYTEATDSGKTLGE